VVTLGMMELLQPSQPLRSYFLLALITFPYFLTEGAYPKALVGVNLSSDDETVHLLGPNALADEKVLAGGDVGDDGATSTEPTASDQIGFAMLERSKPSVTDRASVIPPTGRHG
jgi:hypothetical protein